MTTGSAATIDLAYDVLGLEALFLVPRIFSLLSLNRYFGTLIPCLKEMTKDFVKFLSLVVILYLGKCTSAVTTAVSSSLLSRVLDYIRPASSRQVQSERNGQSDHIRERSATRLIESIQSWILIKVFFG